MKVDLEALREAIDEAGRGLAELEKAKGTPASDASFRVLRAQLGALKATHAALLELDARLIGFPEAVP
jgi:hypothetical protein